MATRKRLTLKARERWVRAGWDHCPYCAATSSTVAPTKGTPTTSRWRCSAWPAGGAGAKATP